MRHILTNMGKMLWQENASRVHLLFCNLSHTITFKNLKFLVNVLLPFPHCDCGQIRIQSDGSRMLLVHPYQKITDHQIYCPKLHDITQVHLRRVSENLTFEFLKNTENNRLNISLFERIFPVNLSKTCLIKPRGSSPKYDHCDNFSS